MSPTPEAPSPTFADPRLAGDPGEVDLARSGLGALGAGDDHDDTIVGPEEPLSALDSLRELAQPIELPDVTFPNRYREGWAVTYSTAIDAEKQLKPWRKAARGKKGELDEIRFATIVLANLCIGVSKGGVPVRGEDGELLTFRHPDMRALYGVGKAGEAARAFYGNDPYMAATLDALLREAGVGEEVEPVDPTEGSPA